MDREEWYKHKTLDRIEQLAEYVELMRDGAVDTRMPYDEIDSLYHGLCVLTSDISEWFRKKNVKCPE